MLLHSPVGSIIMANAVGASLGRLWEAYEALINLEEVFSRAAQALRDLTAKIRDERHREGVLVAPRVRRVLEHH